MQNDSVTWEILGKGKCSFKKKLETETFCLNEYNVTGLCTKVNCPLSNSVYGTVILDKGKIYLYLKCAEKVHLPNMMWTKLLLSLNRKEAFNAIYKEMKYSFNIKQIKKCMKRYVRIKEILKRSRKLILQKKVKLLPVKKKTERRDRTRENKALKAANILNNVEKELLNRLNNGLYGNLYKFLTPKKKIKNKDSELSKIFNEMKEKKMIKKKETIKEAIENEEYENISQTNLSDENEEVDDYEEDDYEEDEDEEDNSDEEYYNDEEDDNNEEYYNDEEELSENLDEEEYLSDDNKYDESISSDKDKNKKKKKMYIKEYVDDDYIKNLQENGKFPNDDEIEEMNHNFRKKRNTNNNKQKSKKKIRIAYEND
ncbi:nucleolar preribosomal assembly protein, putative [Plasmodium relictum]|uniref:Nucleolar preribosomal assembly protein, putative n=1 Tax=Plasmodium relictum TaxID=85471 RepID=A0A1J1H1P1_PLARL|nr:nucleolar preribosomal assembly protein, putative [Plasmodium relictum]CRG98832.1 nucleolar preribosomal assembly protein, putative [Plasmodium relictum]